MAAVMQALPSIIGAGASIVGDLFGQSGQESANKANMAMMLQNEQWQTQMSNTQMQRRVADLKAAGLNLMLAVSSPGASVPGVGQPTMQNPSQSFSNLGSQVTSALQLQQIASQIELQRAGAEKQSADAAIARSQGVYSGERAMWELDNIKKQNDVIFDQARNLEAEWRIKNDAEFPMLMQQKDFNEQFLELRNGIMELDQRRQNLGMPRLENDASWQRSHPVLSGWLQSGATNAATDLINTGLKAFTSGSPLGMGSKALSAIGEWRKYNLRSGDLPNY